MFQRQARQAFPARNILILAAAVLAMLYFLLKKTGEAQTEAPNEPQTEEEKPKNGGLTPAELYFASREYPDFVPDVRAYRQAMAEAKDGVSIRGQYKGFSAPWTTQGPANIGARVNCIAVHPTNHNIIYIGYSIGGVWKTSNGGQTWAPIFDDQPLLTIGEITLDPQNPNTIYVGTGDPNISGSPFIGNGVWKSTNGGQSWQSLGLESESIISKIIVNPTNSNQIYTGAMGLPFVRNNQRGLYKSVNAGNSWDQKLFISDQAGIIDMVMSPSNPNVLYAAAWDRIRTNQESVVSGLNARVWKSVDGGANWTKLGGGLPEDPMSRIGLAIDPTNDQHVFVTYANPALYFGGLYETTNGGQSWQKNPGNNLDPNFQSNFAWYFQKIYVNPYNNQDIWLLGQNTYRSRDGGNYWERAVGDINDVHVDHHAMAFLDANSFLIGTDGGLYKSTDDGVTFFKAENIPTTQFYRVAWNSFEPDSYYGGAQDNGTNTGNSADVNNWVHVFGGDGFLPVFHPTDPNIRYYEAQYGAIYGTPDGAFIDDATIGIEPADRRNWDMPYAISKHDNNYMYTGTYRAYQGYGHLPNWYPISEDLTDGIVFGERYHNISCLDESGLDNDLLYVGTSDGNVWRGLPNSLLWTKISDNLPDRYVSSVKASPTQANRVFVTHTGYKYNEFEAKIYRSEDRGDSWTSISGDLPKLAINDLLILPGYQDSVLFAATDGGVYGTLDGGTHWERLGTKLPFVQVFDLELNPINRTLIAGTHARSIVTFPLDSLKIGENSSTVNIGGLNVARMQVFPNPADKETKISIENLQPKQVAQVMISDLSGRVLWQQRFSGFGKQEKKLDLSTFPAGIYVAFAETEGKIWAKKKFVITSR